MCKGWALELGGGKRCSNIHFPQIDNKNIVVLENWKLSERKMEIANAISWGSGCLQWWQAGIALRRGGVVEDIKWQNDNRTYSTAATGNALQLGNYQDLLSMLPTLRSLMTLCNNQFKGFSVIDFGHCPLYCVAFHSPTKYYTTLLPVQRQTFCR